MKLINAKYFKDYLSLIANASCFNGVFTLDQILEEIDEYPETTPLEAFVNYTHELEKKRNKPDSVCYCKDCIHSEPFCNGDDYWICNRCEEEKGDFLLFMKPDDFCSYGTTEREG